MKVSSEHRAELIFEISDEIGATTNYEDGRKVLRVWSRSDVSPADAVTKVIQLSDALVAALKEAK